MTALLADSATKLGPDAAGRVVVSGSHGGVYAAYLAAKAHCRAVVLNDAGISKDAAGIAGLAFCERLGMAAATVDHAGARIGDAADMLARGRISHANAQARACGVIAGQNCDEASARLAAAPNRSAPVPEIAEARHVLRPPGAHRRLVLVDSAGLVEAADAGQIVVTGSHGAIFGGDPTNALKAYALAAFFNDAGIGPDGIGITRLAALDARAIAAGTVAAASARIGDARSTHEDGMISHLNAHAVALGGRTGERLADFVHRLLRLERAP